MNRRQNTIRELTYELIASGVSPSDMPDRMDVPGVLPEEIGEAITWLASVGRIETKRGVYVVSGDPTCVPFSMRRLQFPEIYL
jgi:hypothetical protein